MQRELFGKTGLMVPGIVFGSSCLGNLYQEIPYKTKLEIIRQWVRNVPAPVAIDSAGKYGAGLALEMIGRILAELRVRPCDVIISNKLGWKRVPLEGPEPRFEPGVWAGIENDSQQVISYNGIIECYEQGCKLLGSYMPQLLSVHDPDEYLDAAIDAVDRDQRLRQVIGAYKALNELKTAGKVKAIGIGAKKWQVIQEIAKEVELDWVMIACSLTIYEHSAPLLSFLKQLNSRHISIINSAVFNAGFLTGGEYFDYRKPDPVKESALFAWRDRFLSICKKHNVRPATACVQFGFSVPGVTAVALNTSRPERIRENVEMVTSRVPDEFWAEMKKENLISKSFPYLG
jgi:D-threo-aldose 1-dehydrogenase